MAKFGETFYSGANNETGGTTDGAFAKTLGSSKNHFFARFTGFIDVDEDGTYGFRGAADDGVRILIDGEPVVSGATGNVNWLTSGNVELTAGRHPFQVDFLEESGWEVLWVQMKKGSGAWEYIPLAKLSSWSGLHSDFGAVTGKGSVALKAAGVAWPGMDLGGFEGRLIANEFTAGPDAGYIAPVNSAIHFMDACDIAGTNWWHSGPAKAITHNGKSAWDMGGVASTDAYANRLKPLDLSKPFTASFDFFIHEPWTSNAGDGFFIGLHDSATGGYGGRFSYDPAFTRINNFSAYGLQAYMMPGSSYFNWIKNNNYIGSVTTNSTYQMNNAKNPAKPYHTTFTWDCEKLVFMFEQDGKAPFAMTNTLAAADIAEKFPGGTAYFGLWVRNGGWYTAMTFADFMIAEGEDGGRETVTLNGVLGITNGVTRVTSSAGADAEIASELLVTGDGALNTEAPAGLTGGKWTFDLREPTAKLALTGEFTLPSDPIVVDLIGEPEARSRVLADLTGIEDNAATFALASDLPGSYNLVYDNGLLKVSAGRGTVIIFR